MSSDLELNGVPAKLWRLVSLAHHRLLMLDYDGTFAPLTVERLAARPLPRSLQLLRRIAAGAHTSVAIISGRPLCEIRRLVGQLPATFIGEHGWEVLRRDGSMSNAALDGSLAAVIDRAEQEARLRGWGRLLERKRSALVLHTRSQPDQRARAMREWCRATWGALASPGQFAVDPVDGGVELRVRTQNKGTAVQSLLAQAPPGTVGVFVGDDVTDEDWFDAVRLCGFGVRVGAGKGPTLAMARLPCCEAVAPFLEQWLTVVRAAPEPAA